MPSHITVLPASTQAGKATIRVLLNSEAKPFVRGLYRDLSKAPIEFIEHPRFEAVKGDVGTETDLDFKDSNAVFYVPPPTYDGRDQGQFATESATNVANALKRAPNVKRLVLHSALGAQKSHGIGIIRLNHISDTILKAAAPEVIIVKPCYYYQSWVHALDLSQPEKPKFESPISPADFQIPMVSVKDVGEYCAKTLLDEATKPKLQSFKLFGPRLYSSLEVKDALQDVLGKEVELINIPKEGLADFWAKALPEAYVQEFVEFTIAQLPGGILEEEYEYGEDTIRAKTELIDDLWEIIS